jgi:hypothetical protein
MALDLFIWPLRVADYLQKLFASVTGDVYGFTEVHLITVNPLHTNEQGDIRTKGSTGFYRVLQERSRRIHCVCVSRPNSEKAAAVIPMLCCVRHGK